jgi:hypothetical protein
MATIIGQTSGSPLIGSPINFQVNAGSYNNPTFHRVKMRVMAGMQNGSYIAIESSSPANEGEQLSFDISDALRAVADSYVYTPTPPEYYPYIQYYLIVWDEYMINGVTYESEKDYFPDSYNVNPLRALMGAYSDMERLLAGENKQTRKFTRKPSTSPEIVYVGDTYIRPTEMVAHSGNIDRGQQSVCYPITTTGLQTHGGAQVYALPRPAKDIYAFRFINGLGAMESVTLRTLRKTDIPVTTERLTFARQETFGTFSRTAAIKQNDYEKWHLTTGPVDEAWQSWFIHEFLKAESAWIDIDGHWIPVDIIPEESVTGISREDNSMLEVEIPIQFGISGSVMSELAV